MHYTLIIVPLHLDNSALHLDNSAIHRVVVADTKSNHYKGSVVHQFAAFAALEAFVTSSGLK